MDVISFQHIIGISLCSCKVRKKQCNCFITNWFIMISSKKKHTIEIQKKKSIGNSFYAFSTCSWMKSHKSHLKQWLVENSPHEQERQVKRRAVHISTGVLFVGKQASIYKFALRWADRYKVAETSEKEYFNGRICKIWVHTGQVEIN